MESKSTKRQLSTASSAFQKHATGLWNAVTKDAVMVVYVLILVLICLITICIVIVLSLATVVSDEYQHEQWDAPQHWMIATMIIGLMLMVWFMWARRGSNHKEHEHMGRHARHARLSLRGIILFYGMGCMLDVNHLIAEFDCIHEWTACNNSFVHRYHSWNVAFHFVRLVFMGGEVVVCWVVGSSTSGARAVLVVTVGFFYVQTANIALLFQSLVSESHARLHTSSLNLELTFLSTSCLPLASNWTRFCPSVTSHNDTLQCCWGPDSGLLHWLEYSNPLLYPIAIEFSLLVLEDMARKLIAIRRQSDGRQPDSAKRNAKVEDKRYSSKAGDVDDGETSDQQYVAHGWLKNVCVAVAIVLNMVLCVLTVLVLIMIRIEDEDHDKYRDWYEWYLAMYLLLLVALSIAGMIVLFIDVLKSGRHFNIHNDSMDYLLLFSAAGSLLSNIKEALVAEHSKSVYQLEPSLNCAQVCLQVLFYYMVKDVLEDHKGVQRNDLKNVNILKTILTAMAVSNGFMWLSKSFFLSDILTREAIEGSEGWHTFDNIVDPVNIFFRFNSALLLWSACPRTEQPRNHRSTQTDHENDSLLSPAPNNPHEVAKPFMCARGANQLQLTLPNRPNGVERTQSDQCQDEANATATADVHHSDV